MSRLMLMLQNQFLTPEWHVTQQWGPLGLRYCRHVCRGETGGDAWSYEQEHTLGLFLSSRPFEYSHRQKGRLHTGLYSKGDLLVTPASMPMVTQASGDVQIVQMRLQDSFLRQVAEEMLEQDRIQVVPAFQTRDPQVESIAALVVAELHQEGVGSRLYRESLANLLAVHVLRNHTTTKAMLPIYDGGLPRRQLIQVLDYIEAHLDADITLAELAELVDMSQFHFGRLFKQSVGRSPYQYLLHQRVERAKALLKQTKLPIVAIALECGFNSHSQFGRKFRQLTGVTPTAYRSV